MVNQQESIPPATFAYICFYNSYTFIAVVVIELKSGKVGLAILSSLNFIEVCQWGMRQSAELETQMTSVERIFEYSELPPEPPLESDEKSAPPADWPQHGNMEFKTLNFRYDENGPRSLRNLTFRIDAKVLHCTVFFQPQKCFS